VAGSLRVGSLSCLFADHRQFARIEPVSGAIWALVHFDLAFRTEEVPVKFYAVATRALPFTGSVHHEALVAFNVQQRFARRLMLFIDLLQFEGIKPNATAAALADVHGEFADLDFGQLIEAGWTFHRLGT
jgi:hypothetical protein